MITFNPDRKIYTSTKINDSKYFSGFSTSELGDARDLNNISNFFRKNSIDFNQVVILEQIHSVNIEIYQPVGNADKIIFLKETDGIITRNTETVLVVRNADCAPIIYTDKIRGLIGISHQGWRGSLKNMAAKMIAGLLRAGAKTEDILCAIGPAIGACCYDMDDDRYLSYLDEYEAYSDKIFMRRSARWHLNLAYLNYLQLISSGVKKNNIDFFPFCTKCDRIRFFSRRRSKSSDFPEMFNFVMKV